MLLDKYCIVSYILTMARGRRFRRRRRTRGRRPRRLMNGGQIRGRLHPTTSTASPWNNYALWTMWSFKDGETGVKCFLAQAAVTALKTELGIATTTLINFRLSRVDLWVKPGATNSDRNFIVLAPCDWTRSMACDKARNINWFEAWGTAVQPAHIHYLWPRSISNVVLTGTDSEPLFDLDVQASCSYLVKLHLTWRPASPDPSPAKGGVITNLRMREPPPPGDFEYITERCISPLHQGDYMSC